MSKIDKWEGVHCTYFLDGGNNLGEDTAQTIEGTGDIAHDNLITGSYWEGTVGRMGG